MIDDNLRQEAGILRAKLEMGHLNIPELLNFLTRLEGQATPRQKKRRDRMAEQLAALDKRARPRR